MQRLQVARHGEAKGHEHRPGTQQQAKGCRATSLARQHLGGQEVTALVGGVALDGPVQELQAPGPVPGASRLFGQGVQEAEVPPAEPFTWPKGPKLATSACEEVAATV
jgi:hypothetical protein